jgi:hypothetical protein
MPVKWGLLLPDLKEKSADFYTGSFFSLRFFLLILFNNKSDCVIVPFKCHPLNGLIFTLFFVITWTCSKTTLTGESWFYISTPLGIEPGSLMTGSKRVVHWTSETWMDAVRLQALHRAPPNSRLCGCEAGRRTCSERETGIEELCEIKWDCQIVCTRA